MTQLNGLSDISPEQLREMLRDHAVVIAPGEALVVMVPPSWPPHDVRDLQDALRAACFDPDMGIRFPVLVVPGNAIAVAAMPPDPFGEGGTPELTER